jgi:hypothetical protein
MNGKVRLRSQPLGGELDARSGVGCFAAAAKYHAAKRTNDAEERPAVDAGIAFRCALFVAARPANHRVSFAENLAHTSLSVAVRGRRDAAADRISGIYIRAHISQRASPPEATSTSDRDRLQPILQAPARAVASRLRSRNRATRRCTPRRRKCFVETGLGGARAFAADQGLCRHLRPVPQPVGRPFAALPPRA